MTIQSNRTLGGLGACFSVVGTISTVVSLIRYTYPSSSANLALGIISGIVGVISFVGFILFLIAMYGFSKDYRDHRIFDYIIYGIIITIVAAVIAVVIWLVFFFSNIGTLLPSLNNQPTSADISFAATPFVGLINIIFNVRAFNLLADKSEVPMFKSAAKVLLAGGLVSVVLGIIFAAFAANGLFSFEDFRIILVPGGLIQEIAWVLLAVSFFKIKPSSTQTYASTTGYAPSLQLKYCPNCGAQNQTDSTYCVQCGKKL